MILEYSFQADKQAVKEVWGRSDRLGDPGREVCQLAPKPLRTWRRKPWRLSDMFCSIFQDYPEYDPLLPYAQHTPPRKSLMHVCAAFLEISTRSSALGLVDLQQVCVEEHLPLWSQAAPFVPQV